MSNLTPSIPDFEIKKRILTQSGDYEWVTMNKETLFDGKRVVIFGLPGAFTPTCSPVSLKGSTLVLMTFIALLLMTAL